MVKTWILKKSTPSRKKKNLHFLHCYDIWQFIYLFIFGGSPNPVGVPSLVAIIPFLFVPLKKEIQENGREIIVGIIFLKVNSRRGGNSAETD